MINKVIISLASNHDQEQNLHQARLCLAQILSSCQYTEAIWTEPYSATLRTHTRSERAGTGPVPTKVMYLNQLVRATTEKPVEELEATLKEIERKLGRSQEDRRQGIVRIDLDLLQYNQQRYHLRDWDREYVKMLMKF